LLVTPAVAALAVWLTLRFFRGAEGSGIPQVIATLHRKPGEYGARLLSLRILVGKIAVSFLAILGGLTIGREGPTVQVGAALMFNLRRFYPRSNAQIERQLVLAVAAAGLSAAFNTPLAGIVFAIEELTRSFEARASGVLITAIIIAGVIALGLNGNYTYFGTIQVGAHFPDLLALAVLLTAVVTGIAGGVFGWLLLNTARWIPAPLRELHRERPVAFAALCGFAIAVVGLISGGATFGSGYSEARALLDGHERLSVFYPLLKMIALIGSYLPGIPGGIFAPSLSIGAGFGNLLHMVFDSMQLPMLIALAMVGYLAAVTQSPITSFVIVMEMIDGHALVISLMATALISSRVAALFAPPLYESLALRYMAPTAPANVPDVPEASESADMQPADDEPRAEDSTETPRQ
jgi:H+/Cl- antiporter ClcA